MKPQRTLLLVLALLCSCAAIPPASAVTITTKSYEITITENCEEDVACQDVDFSARRIHSGRLVRLKGRAVTSICNDGITPCHHFGYKFVDGNTIYFVSDEDWLEISRDDEVILHEDVISRARD